MGSTKAAMESLVRYFAVARRETGDNCQCGQSWMDGE
jgi:enoyl-[acyl-carrier-protein] reductase (NADH)